jgi:site-specific DNA recombinase
MDTSVKKLARCAIYTRKSTEHNLDLEFNSLDAQREACAAYIKSQAHEGWRLIRDRYDDGAFSGASLERPALQNLLADVWTGKIDVIVVYKVDRLARSLADFAKLVELFDQHSVSFVSVTQHFNTTSSMGRLTLNVLLSFAQFERELIGERVRDKIAASKRKGIWVGGPVPLGYASINKKLVLVPNEAETVRTIFRRYLDLGSIRTLMQELDQRGIRTKRRAGANGRTAGGIRFGVGPLAHLLRNRFYIGEIVYRGKVHRGQHEPIVDEALFEAVQAKLAAGAAARSLRLRGSAAILAGRIFDDRGNRMTPTHTNKNGARYRYYVSHAILQKRENEAGSVSRTSAPDVERAVIKAVREYCASGSNGDAELIDDRELIAGHVERITINASAIEIQLVQAACFEQEHTGHKSSNRQSKDRSMLIVPWLTTGHSNVKGILHTPFHGTANISGNRDRILMAIARARAWVQDLIDGRAASFAEIAKRQGKVERYIRLLAPLAFVSPRLLSEIIDGRVSPDLTVTGLAQALAYSWAKQEGNRPSAFESGGRGFESLRARHLLLWKCTSNFHDRLWPVGGCRSLATL